MNVRLMRNRLIHDEHLANILSEVNLTHQWSYSIEIFVLFGISFIWESIHCSHKNPKTVWIRSLIDFCVKMKIMKCILLNLAKMFEVHHSKKELFRFCKSSPEVRTNESFRNKKCKFAWTWVSSSWLGQVDRLGPKWRLCSLCALKGSNYFDNTDSLQKLLFFELKHTWDILKILFESPWKNILENRFPKMGLKSIFDCNLWK